MGKIIIANKPKGKTSYQIIREFKKKLDTKKIGHAGTLDPFASGVLILLIGKATKKFSYFQTLDKTYLLTIQLGQSTDTLDSEGKITKQIPWQKIDKSTLTKPNLNKILKSFQGTQTQTIPAFSAAKYKGKPFYYYARQNIPPPDRQKTITIKKINLTKIISNAPYPQIEIKVICSSGSYMRQLAVDIGNKLDYPAHAKELKRIKVGDYSLDKAVTP